MLTTCVHISLFVVSYARVVIVQLTWTLLRCRIICCHLYLCDWVLTSYCPDRVTLSLCVWSTWGQEVNWPSLDVQQCCLTTLAMHTSHFNIQFVLMERAVSRNSAFICTIAISTCIKVHVEGTPLCIMRPGMGRVRGKGVYPPPTYPPSNIMFHSLSLCDGKGEGEGSLSLHPTYPPSNIMFHSLSLCVLWLLIFCIFVYMLHVNDEIMTTTTTTTTAAAAAVVVVVVVVSS